MSNTLLEEPAQTTLDQLNDKARQDYLDKYWEEYEEWN